jgi:probable rRNA maturation factor
VNVQIQCEHPRGHAAAARLRRRARAFLGRLGMEDAQLSILLVGDRGMRRLNRTWRGMDVPTDVLSFPAAESARPLLGDVVLSLDTAARVARAERRPLEEELDRYLVHGILHLLGFDHERGPEDARAMASREDEVLGGEGMVAAAREPARAGPARARAAGAKAKPKASARTAATRRSPRSGAKESAPAPAAKRPARPGAATTPARRPRGGEAARPRRPRR